MLLFELFCDLALLKKLYFSLVHSRLQYWISINYILQINLY